MNLDEEGTVEVSRPVGCDVESGTATDLKSEPARWLAFGEYLRWFDADSCPVRIDVISHNHGPEHCGWQDAEFIVIAKTLGTAVESFSRDTSNRYIWNPDRVIDALPPGDTITRADLPASAIDTGYSQGDKQLWLEEADESVLYVVEDDIAEIWVRDFEVICA